jgi:regulator of sigma E protease
VITLLSFIFTISVLVVVHEYGHYQVARWCGIRVLRFSVGFGKPLWKKTIGKHGTEFVLAAIPLGGYVKMLDERELKQEQEDAANGTATVQYSEQELQQAFNRKSVYQRIAVVIAGPVANLLLAVLLYSVLFMSGTTGLRPIIGYVQPDSLASMAHMRTGDEIFKVDGEPVQTWQDVRWILLNKSLEKKSVRIETINTQRESHVHSMSLLGVDDNPEVDVLQKLGVEMLKPNVPAVIGEVLAGSAAETAHFQTGDKIIAIDNIMVSSWENVVSNVRTNPKKQLQFKVLRDGASMKINATPSAYMENGKTIGRLGASVKYNEKDFDKLLINTTYSPLQSLHKGISKTWETSIFSLKMLWRMLLGQTSFKSISGPVSIASYAGESASMGWKTFVGFLALVSISIGVLNLLPIPVLDGGHLMYYIVEILKGSPVSEYVMMTGQKIGLTLLGVLMVVALFNDIGRFVTGL